MEVSIVHCAVKPSEKGDEWDMPRLMVIYRIKPDKFDLAIKRWAALADPNGPPAIKEAVSKLDIETMEFAAGCSFIMAVYNVKDENMVYGQMLSLFLCDAFTIEVYPVLPADEHGRAFDMFSKIKQ